MRIIPKIKNKPLRWLVNTIAACLLLLMLLLLGISLLLPFADSRKVQLAAELSRSLNAQVSIGSIDSHWEGVLPFLDLKDIHIEDKSDTGLQIKSKRSKQDSSARLPIQTVDRLSIGLNLWEMVTTGSVIPNQMQVKGLSVSLVQSANGQWRIPGVNTDSDQPVNLDSLIRNKNLTLSHASVQIHPYKQPPKLLLNDVKGHLNTRGNRIQAGVGFDLLKYKQTAAQVLTPVRLNVDVKGDINDLSTWDGVLDVDVPTIDLKRLNRYFNIAEPLQSGEFAMNTQLKLKSGRIESSKGGIDLSMHQKGLDVQWHSPIRMTSTAGKIDVQTPNPLLLNGEPVDFLKQPRLELDTEKGLGVFWRFEQVAIPVLLSKLEPLLKYAGKQANTLHSLNAKGEMNNVLIGWRLGDGLEAQASLLEASWKSSGDIPAVSNLSALIIHSKKRTRLVFNDAFDYLGGPLFPEPIQVQSFKGDIDVFKRNGVFKIQSQHLVLNTADVESKHVFYFSTPEKPQSSPTLKLESNIKNGQMKHAMRYVPRALTPQTLAWFEQAFLGGVITKGNVQINGPVNQWFKKDSDAIFKITADVENAEFSYSKKWPKARGLSGQFTMDKRRLHVVSSAGQVLKIKPKQVTFTIEDVSRSAMTLTVNAGRVPASAVMHFVQTSPINRYINQSADAFAANGWMNGTFEMYMPLSERHFKNRNPTFKGALNLNGVKLNIKPARLVIEQLKGPLAFTHKSIDASALKGQVFGQPASIKANTIESNGHPRAQITLNTQLPMKAAMTHYAPLLSRYVDGKTPIKVIAGIPFSSSDRPTQIDFYSRLNGASIKLPKPMQLTSVQIRPVSAQLQLLKNGQRLSFSAKRLVDGKLLFSKNRATKGYINVQSKNAGWSKQSGVELSIYQSDLSLDAWLPVYRHLSQNMSNSTQLFITQVTGKFDRMSVSKLNLKNVSFSGQRENEYWQYAVLSNAVKGIVKSPNINDAHSGLSAWKLKLEELTLDNVFDTKPSMASEAFNPEDIPPLDLSIRRFKWNAIRLDNLSAKMKAYKQGMEVSNIRVNNDSMNFSGHALWGEENGKHLSDVRFNANINDAGKALKSFGFDDLFSQGDGVITGHLRWNDALYRPDIPSLSGDVSIDLNDGDLLGVKPGVAALFAVLNVDALPKRLALNFRDMDDKGLTFNTMKGEGRLSQGILNIKPFKIGTDMGNIHVHGRVDLAKEQLNLIAEVNPDVTVVIPVAAGVIGGVPGFIGAFLFGKAVKAFSKDSDKVAQVWYEIKGPLNDPKVASTKVKRIKDLSKGELAKRLKEIQLKQNLPFNESAEKGELAIDEDDEELLFEE